MLGKIQISEDVIAVIAGNAAMECYGLVGMASRKITDGLAELFRGDQAHKGVYVTRTDEQEVSIDLYIIVQYGVKISEVAHNIQERVKYLVENTTGLRVARVNVTVQGVRLQES
ncbi:Asp23/Gls24 family envelope stress response protein [Carboxydocella sp. JDF658]|uniref:Asp23/Gls24 family envelope stress response protein n=1 Tax=Carboxydocella sp. JDF658 TaxID=1926600 RepID=UPI0009AE7791|nr:Asp23/Gls24 family envelope stress response protein [Carboxydocella sp. JDF658]GAW30966.1 hypothetical protein JDF658_07310 [Carboxydocella sp. JDF658]